MARPAQTASLSLVAFVGVLVMPSAGQASDLPGLQPDMRIAVRGTVPVRCSLTSSTGGGAFEQPQSSANTTRADALSLGFEIVCNTGFAVRMASARGGLTQGSRPMPSPFADRLAYDAGISLPGRASVLSCRSTAMSSGPGDCSGTVAEDQMVDGVVSGRGEIDLRLVDDGRPLLAGRYEDFLVVTLSPLMGGSGGAS